MYRRDYDDFSGGMMGAAMRDYGGGGPRDFGPPPPREFGFGPDYFDDYPDEPRMRSFSPPRGPMSFTRGPPPRERTPPRWRYGREPSPPRRYGPPPRDLTPPRRFGPPRDPSPMRGRYGPPEPYRGREGLMPRYRDSGFNYRDGSPRRRFDGYDSDEDRRLFDEETRQMRPYRGRPVDRRSPPLRRPPAKFTGGWY